MRPIVLIPARLRSTRLPRKPLAEIHGEPMIVHVWRRAVEANIGPVAVACEEREIADVVRAAGGEAVTTAAYHTSGSDRVFEAAEILDPKKTHDVVVNLQGDLPTIEPAALRRVLVPLSDPDVNMSTLASPLQLGELENLHVVKVRLEKARGCGASRAAAFARDGTPCADFEWHHHIGVYAYRRAALERFVALPPSTNEQAIGLEQLRAMDAGMLIGVGLVDTFPLGVDTYSDLALARAHLAASTT